MADEIICRTTEKDVQSFYLKHDGQEFYLFAQAYRKRNRNVFCNGVLLANVFKLASHKSFCLQKTIDKLKIYIPYIEKEYGIAVLRKTKQQHEKCRRGSKFYRRREQKYMEE